MLVFLSTKLGNLYAVSVQGHHIILMCFKPRLHTLIQIKLNWFKLHLHTSA